MLSLHKGQGPHPVPCEGSKLAVERAQCQGRGAHLARVPSGQGCRTHWAEVLYWYQKWSGKWRTHSLHSQREDLKRGILGRWIWALVRRLSSGGLSDALPLKSSGTHVAVPCCSLLGHSGGSTWVIAGKRLPAQVRGVLPKVSPDVGGAALLAFFAPLYKMMGFLHLSQTSVGVPKAVARAPHPGEPNLPVPGIPEISICPSFTHAHTTYFHTCSSRFFTLSLSLPAVLSATIFSILVYRS